MNIYSYSRTSTLEHIYTERDSELSLETELLAIQTYCLQRNWYLSEDFSLEFAKAAELFSKLDKKKSAERIKSVKQKQRNKGRYLGGSRPFGYMVHENGKLIENPLEQRLLRRILELKRAGNSLRSISVAVSTPLAPVSFKTVQRLLQRHADRL